MSSAAAMPLPGIVAHLERFLEPLAETDQLAARFLIAGETFEAPAPKPRRHARRRKTIGVRDRQTTRNVGTTKSAAEADRRLRHAGRRDPLKRFAGLARQSRQTHRTHEPRSHDDTTASPRFAPLVRGGWSGEAPRRSSMTPRPLDASLPYRRHRVPR
jgi:hypothetical protein